MWIINISNSFKALNLAALVICAVTAQSAMADIKVAAATKVDPDFSKLDSNHNGKISLKEAVKDKGLSTNFDAVDANKDGIISSDEFAAYKVASTGNTSPSELTPVESMEPVPTQ